MWVGAPDNTSVGVCLRDPLTGVGVWGKEHGGWKTGHHSGGKGAALESAELTLR